MLQAIRERATVKPGGILELHHPELPAGADVDVIIMVERPTMEASAREETPFRDLSPSGRAARLAALQRVWAARLSSSEDFASAKTEEIELEERRPGSGSRG